MYSVPPSRGFTQYLGIALFALGIASLSPSHAADCVLDQLPNKSQGVTVQRNDCESPALSVGAVLELKPGGRLWVRAASRAQEENSFEVICQNRHSQAVHMSVASVISPWLAPVDMKTCNNWAGGRLVCERGGQKTALVCAIAAINRTLAAPSDAMSERTTSTSDSGMMESTTSVKMRSVAPLVTPKQMPSDQELMTAALQPLQQQAELCRQLYQTQQSLDIEWTVAPTGTVQDLLLHNPVDRATRDFAECVISAIKDFTYPSLSHPVTLTQRF